MNGGQAVSDVGVLMGGKGGQDIRDAPETRHFRCRVTCAGGLTSCIIGA